MIVISNTSPLIALSRIHQLSILKNLFQKVYIPQSVFQESVLQSNVAIQKENIAKAIAEEFIMVAKNGVGVISLRSLLRFARERKPTFII